MNRLTGRLAKISEPVLRRKKQSVQCETLFTSISLNNGGLCERLMSIVDLLPRSAVILVMRMMYQIGVMGVWQAAGSFRPNFYTSLKSCTSTPSRLQSIVHETIVSQEAGALNPNCHACPPYTEDLKYGARSERSSKRKNTNPTHPFCTLTPPKTSNSDSQHILRGRILY